jgi:hypothetical protein
MAAGKDRYPVTVLVLSIADQPGPPVSVRVAIVEMGG